MSVLSVFKFLLLIPIKASLKFKAFSASSIVCTSTITYMLNLNASSYNSFAKSSDTPARIIKIASAP